MNKKGSVNIIIAVIIAAVVAGGAYYFVSQKTDSPVSIITPANNQETLSQLLSASDGSKVFLSELQRLNPKLDINKSTGSWDWEKSIITEFSSWPIMSVKKPSIVPDSNYTRGVFSPNGQNIFFDYRCYEEGDRETLDVSTTINNKTEVRTIFDWGMACPNGNGFWLSDTKLAYLHTYSYTQEEPESSNFTPASTRAVTIHIFDLTKNIADTYYVTSPDIIIWPSLSGIYISTDGKSIIDSKGITLLSKGNIFLNMEEMLLSGQFVSFAKENNFQRYDDAEHSNFLNITPLPQSSYMISACLNCNEDLYGYEVSFIFNTTDGILRYFYGEDPRFSTDRNLVILRFGGGAEITAWGENIYEVATAKLIGRFYTIGTISDFAKQIFNITTDTFVTFDFSPDSKSIIITPQVYDGNNYKPFASKLIADLDGKNLRVFNQ